MEIIFSKEDHRYTSGDQVFTSVSKVLSKYKNEFNHDHWSTYKALEVLIPDFKTFKKGWNIDTPSFIEYASQHVDPSLLVLEKSKILSSWEDTNLKSINKGNHYHERREAMSYEQGFEINPFTGEKFQITETPSGEKTNLVSNLYNLQDGFYPELLIWNNDTLIAGQADKVFIETIGDNRYVDIDDYKGLALDTPILTDSGWKTMGTLFITDKVYDGNGIFTEIENISEIHYNPCYELKFDNGEVLIADHEHRWLVDYQLYEKDEIYETRDIDFLGQGFSINCPDGKIVKIISCKRIDTVPTKCIAVKSDTHCYLVGNSMIKTHNTNKQIKKTSYRSQKMKPPLSHLMDCNHTHYNLQISFYAWMLEEFGFHVRNLSFHHFNQMYKLKYLRSEVKTIAKNG